MQKSQDRIDQEEKEEEAHEEPKVEKQQPEEEIEEPPKKGTLKDMISTHEKTWRNLTRYESVEDGLEPMAAFIRNKIYHENQLRTEQALATSCQYLFSNILSLLDDQKYEKLETIEYIVDRLRAIRCQYHVQNVMEAQVFDKLVRFYILAFPISRDSAQLRSTLDSYIGADCKAILKPQILLTMLLLTPNQFGYLQILSRIPDDVLESEQIQRIIRLANVVWTEDFGKYFRTIKQLNLIQGLLMCMFIDRMRLLAIRCYAKAQLTLSVEYLREQLYFDKPEDVVQFLSQVGYAQATERQGNIDKIMIVLKKPQAQIKTPLYPTKIPSSLTVSPAVMMKYINDA